LGFEGIMPRVRGFLPVMSKTLHFLEQAARFDRVADQCSVPELVPYYRKRAQECRDQAAVVAMSPGEDGAWEGAAE
jgi:hypothetical protein